jgi:hypothetical protein
MTQKNSELREYLNRHPPKKEGDYAKVAKRFKVSADSVRKTCERMKLPNVRINMQSKRNDEGLIDRVMRSIEKKKRTVVELANHLDVSPKAIQETLKEMRANNVIIDIFDDAVQLASEMKPIGTPNKIDFRKYKEVEYPIGFVTDNHIGSKYERLDVLNALYDRFESYGITKVYNGGNMIDGECRFNKYDIYVHGANDQVKNLIDKYPQRKGIVTEFVTGDDHEGWYVQREHINIGQMIEDEAKRSGRNDLIHLGYMERDIEYKQARGSSIIRVIHAGGGSSYAHSYTAQKYVEALQGGEKPAIILVGHYHKYNHSYPREVHVIQGGCTEDQTPFMRKNKIQAMVGGVVLWIKQNELGIFTSVKVEWIPFYDRRFYKYQW